ncbi:acylneuraminate cytidylyltransferase family protein [Candidatus Woesearchaeota archaeon]|nr:acylneuraminate cytidylyltransferase family protein [Candidatus Woesearchaeota archaeon]
MKTLAIIPARAGSRGVPGKNIRLLNGKPLIAYTIEAARASKLVSEIAVTTDDIKVKGIANNYGVEIIERPAELALDNTPMLPVLQHAVKSLEESYDCIILLQPTSPFRTANDIDECIKKLGDFDAVYSIAENKESPLWSFKIEKECIVPLLPFDKTKTLRQESEKSYYLNGAIYAYKKEVLMGAKEFPLKNVSCIIMPPERSVEIDTEFDFRVAEVLLNDKSRK